MAETDTENLQELDTGLIDPSPYQPRRVFDETALLALADSIRQHGMLQPVMVRAVGDRYELILGERRVRACQRLGRPVLARIQDLSDADAEREALAENLLRAPLSAMEKARAFGTLADKGWSRLTIATRLSLELSDIEYHLRLLNLRPEYQALVEQGLLSVPSACDLARLPHEAQPAVFALYRRGKHPYEVGRLITATLEARSQAVLMPADRVRHEIADKLRDALDTIARQLGACTSRQTLELVGWVTAGQVDRNLQMAVLAHKALGKIVEALRVAKARTELRAEVGGEGDGT